MYLIKQKGRQSKSWWQAAAEYFWMNVLHSVCTTVHACLLPRDRACARFEWAHLGVLIFHVRVPLACCMCVCVQTFASLWLSSCFFGVGWCCQPQLKRWNIPKWLMCLCRGSVTINAFHTSPAEPQYIIECRIESVHAGLHGRSLFEAYTGDPYLRPIRSILLDPSDHQSARCCHENVQQ